jgi:hypothetical protein
MRSKLLAATLLLSACATPHVVESVRVGDLALNCTQLLYAMDETDSFRASADKERGATGTNVAAVLFFWPALLGTYSNINEAVAAADNRKIHLVNLYQQKNCMAQTGIGNPLARRSAAVGGMDALADLNEVDGVPFVNDAGREAYRRSFLGTRQRPRAFAVSEKGNWAFRSGQDAAQQAKAACEQRGNPCFIYAFNDEVMFRQFVKTTAPQAASVAPQVARALVPPPASVDPRLADVQAVPNLGESGKDLYEKFLATKRRPRAFALSWTGASSWSTGPDAERKAIESCSRYGGPCFTYALDNSVVWTGTIALDAKTCDPAHVDPKLCDVDAVPVRAEGKERYKAFLLITERPRAFVVSETGGWRFLAGANATERAMELCRGAGMACRVYAEDDKVVWKAP